MPLAIDLYCGLGGWTQGLLAEGYDVIGYDIEAHEYDGEKYPAELRLQDVLTINGSELADADLIVGSSPCQEYSYMAMPWTRAKAKRAAILADTTGEARRRLNALFDAQFRIQREASAAKGRRIPMVVENVRGAQEWVGPAAWNFGSYYLWGDVPALMPNTIDARKNPGFRFDGSGGSFQTASVERHIEARKNNGGSWFNIGGPGQKEVGMNPVHALTAEGRKGGNGSWFNDYKSRAEKPSALLSMTSSKSPARKAASAKIAKIPLALSRHIARVYRP